MIKYLKTRHQRKSALMTLILMGLLFFAMYFFGMKYLDPPEEYGISINFGTSDVGSGVPKSSETVNSSPKPTNPTQKVVTPENAQPVKEVKEKLLTQEKSKAPVFENEETPENKKPANIPEEPIEKVVKKEVPKPSKETRKALSNLLRGSKSKGNNSEGEGDDSDSGLKGKIDGDPSSSKYYGSSGAGENGNYNLSGRKPLTRPIVKPNCNEEGIVVVSIEVDKSGKVIKAIPGAKGSTNTSPCLLSPAKSAAMRTKWNEDQKAPTKQVGIIIYQFSLSE